MLITSKAKKVKEGPENNLKIQHMHFFIQSKFIPVLFARKGNFIPTNHQVKGLLSKSGFYQL